MVRGEIARMKTKQELIEEYRAEVGKETQLEQNENAAHKHCVALYHRGRKEAFLHVVNYLVRWDIKCE
jgi:hypothetical protein